MRGEKKSLDWRAGYAAIQHRAETIERVEIMLDHLVGLEQLRDRERGRILLHAADRIASQAMWLIAHMTYAQRVHLDGRKLRADDFKLHPAQCTGDAFNVAIAYVGYLLANALTSDTRAWVMEQHHCIAALDAVNVLLRNTCAAFAARYTYSDEGLSRLCADFYAPPIACNGGPQAPLDSCVNAHTAIGLQYVHMPLPGQKLVALLSDSAFEKQRGIDWAPRWWRAEDCGLVAPLMITNSIANEIADGRSIERRTPINQSGGSEWFQQHLRLNNFEPIAIDGNDPAAFAWAIITQERYLEHSAHRIAEGKAQYPVRLPYTIATVASFGFPDAAIDSARDLALPANPRDDAGTRALFNAIVRKWWVDPVAFEAAVFELNNHVDSGRVRECDHALAQLRVDTPKIPALAWCSADASLFSNTELSANAYTPSCYNTYAIWRSPLTAIDAAFAAIVQANPQLRARVGNFFDDPRVHCDESHHGRFSNTLNRLKNRVIAPAAGVAEASDGGVITSLNAETVAGAALGNKQGLNLIVSDEASAVKMLGNLRQEIIFSRRCKENTRAPGWLSVPLLAIASTWERRLAWEYGLSEQAQQDPTLVEALLGEMSDVSRVLFPVDWNSAIAALIDVYNTHGVIAAIVAPQKEMPSLLDETAARACVQNGIALISGSAQAPVQLLAIGAYQLQQALLAAARLQSRALDVSVWVVLEPGRFRVPRDSGETAYCGSAAARLPSADYRVLFCHTHPEIMLGTLRAWDLGPARTRALGYINRGGALDTFGMLYANRCTWAHGVRALVEMREDSLQNYFDAHEIAALHGQ